jgi:hypothetical protein
MGKPKEGLEEEGEEALKNKYFVLYFGIRLERPTLLTAKIALRQTTKICKLIQKKCTDDNLVFSVTPKESATEVKQILDLT